MQLHGADRAVALLGDDDISEAIGRLTALFPALVAVVEFFRGLLRAMRRLGPRQVILLAENEHDDVGVLLDRAGFTQIRQLRPLVLALLDGARELRAGDHRHFQFLGDCFQAAGDVGDFLDAVLHGAALRRGTHQLQVVDDDHAEPLLTLEAARAGA